MRKLLVVVLLALVAVFCVQTVVALPSAGPSDSPLAIETAVLNTEVAEVSAGLVPGQHLAASSCYEATRQKPSFVGSL